MSKEKKFWKVMVNDPGYGIRGHKLYAVLSFVCLNPWVTYTELNKFSYNYTRRGEKNPHFTGKKFDKIINRGYIGSNLYGGYIGKFLKKNSISHYRLTSGGYAKVLELHKRFVP